MARDERFRNQGARPISFDIGIGRGSTRRGPVTVPPWARLPAGEWLD